LNGQASDASDASDASGARTRRWVLAGTGLLVLLLLVSARGLTWREDVLELLPDSDPVVHRYRELLSVFRPTDYLYLDVGPAVQGGEPDMAELLAVADALAASLASGLVGDPPLLDSLLYRRGPEEVLSALETLRRHRAALFSEAERARVEAGLDPGAIGNTLSEWKRLLAGSPAPLLAAELARDPLHLDAGLARDLAALQPGGGAITVHQGRLFSADLRHVLMIARPRFPSTDGARAKELIEFVERSIESAREQAGGDVRIAYLSGHRFSLENARRIRADLERVLTVSFAGIALLSLLAFRRPLFAFLVLLPAAFGALFSAGLIRWLVPDISAISIGCGSMLVGISVDYGIHLLFHCDRAPRERPTHVLRRLLRPLLLGSATTVAAFSSLQASVMPGFRHLGWVAVLGITGAAAFAILVLPLLIPAGGGSHLRAPLADFGRRVPLLFAWARARRPLVSGFLIVSTAIALAGLTRLEFDGDYRNLNGASRESLRDFEILSTRFDAALEGSSLAVSADSPQAALEQNERVWAQLAAFEREELLESYRSIAPLLPSLRTQQENLDRWRSFWSKERIARLSADLRQAAREHGLVPDAFEPFLSGLPGELSPLRVRQWDSGVLSDLRETHFAESDGRRLILSGARRSEGVDFDSIVKRLETAAPGILAADGRHFIAHLVTLIYREMVRVGWVALLLILIPLSIGLRRAGRILSVLLPPLVCLIWTFGLMGWFAIRINMMNCIVGVFIFGLVIDYALFLSAAWSADDGGLGEQLKHSGGAVAVSALTTLLGVGSLALAGHPALHIVGLTAVVGIGCGWLAVLLIVPLSSRTAVRTEATFP